MKNEKYILVLDIGTSSVKAGIFDSNLNIVSETRHNYRYDASPDMSVQIDMKIIWEACLYVMQRFKQWLKRIEVVIPSVFCPGLVAMDRNGKALYPAIIHIDRRSIKQANESLRIVGKEKFLKITGNLPYPGGISLTSVLWLKEHENDVFKKTCKFGHVNTYIAKRLTGEWGIDPTNASFTGLYETVRGNNWSHEITKELGIPIEKLPPIIIPHQVIGHITKEVSRVTGLRDRIPVLIGANDTTCAALGAGVIEEGQTLNIVGSSEIFVICMNKPLPDGKYYLRQHAIPGRWLMLVITTAGFSLEWFRRQFCKEMDKYNFYNTYLPHVLKQRKAGSVCFRAHLAGDRNSFKKKRASFSGLTLATTRDECLSALIKGSMVPMRNAINKCWNFMKLRDTIFLTGGGLTQTLIEYKKSIFPDFNFEVKRDCSLLGGALIGKEYLCNSF